MEKETLNGSIQPPQKQSNLKPLLRQAFVVMGVVLNMTSVGCAIGYPAILLPKLKSNESSVPINDNDPSGPWIASILGLAITNGNLLVPFMLFKLGRKMTNQVSTIPIIAGWGFIVTANSVPQLILGRYLQGLGMGLQVPSATISVGEYTSPKTRGAFLVTISLSLALGMLVVHLIGTFLDWPATGIICSFFSIAALVIMLLSPETPQWLASKGKFEQCRKSFTWLRGNDEESNKELESIISTQVVAKKYEAKQPEKSLKEKIIYFFSVFAKKEFYKPIIIMFFLFFVFQFAGTNVLPTYTLRIMEEIMGKEASRGNLPYVAMIVLDVVRLLSAICSVVVVRTMKRRTVLVASSGLTILFLLLTSLYMYLRDGSIISSEHYWIPILTLVLYIIVLTMGIAAIPWAIAGEIFPLAYKPIGGALSGIFVSSLLFASVQTAPGLFNAIGVKGTFVFYAAATGFCALMLHILLPETKGKTLQEIENHFKGVKNFEFDAQKEQMLPINHQKQDSNQC